MRFREHVGLYGLLASGEGGISVGGRIEGWCVWSIGAGCIYVAVKVGEGGSTKVVEDGMASSSYMLAAGVTTYLPEIATLCGGDNNSWKLSRRGGSMPVMAVYLAAMSGDLNGCCFGTSRACCTVRNSVFPGDFHTDLCRYL